MTMSPGEAQCIGTASPGRASISSQRTTGRGIGVSPRTMKWEGGDASRASQASSVHGLWSSQSTGSPTHRPLSRSIFMSDNDNVSGGRIIIGFMFGLSVCVLR